MKVSEIEKTCEEKIAKIETCLAGMEWESTDLYAEWLAQTYFYVRHATRVLATAALRVPFEEEFVHDLFLKSMAEEQGHEKLALNDLNHIGFDIEPYTENLETSCYYQTLYYKGQYEGPAAIFGYFLPLEGMAAKGFNKTIERVKSHYGKEAMSFIDVHCLVDQGHYKEGIQTLEDLPSHYLNIIYKNVEFSGELYLKFLEGVKHSTFLKISQQ